MMPTSKVTQSSADAASGESVVQSIGSVLIFAHLFFLVIALSANQAPSRYDAAPSTLQDRLLTVFRPYFEFLNFDVRAVRFYLTHAATADAEYRIEYLPAGSDAQDADAWRDVAAGGRGSDRMQRYQRLADRLALVGSADDSAQAAEIASAVATGIARQTGEGVSQIRSRRHLLQGPEELTSADLARRDPNDASYFQEVYRAQVVDLGGQRLGVQKVEARGQVAPTVSGRKRNAPEPRSP